jgi:hypothetical protein
MIRQSYPLDHGSHVPILVGIGKSFTIRRILEIGAGGYSTPLFLNRNVFPSVEELVSVERDLEWMKKMSDELRDSRILLMDQEPGTELERFDMIFVDNAYSLYRANEIKNFSERPSLRAIVVVHDSENSMYKTEIEKFNFFYDFGAYDPDTSAMWNGKLAPWEQMLPVFESIGATIREHSDVRPDDVPTWLEIFTEKKTKEVPKRSFSIAMAAYDPAPLLRNTLETIKMQTRKPDQIIVVEDGFDGGKTEAVCEEARSYGLPIEYICRRNRPNVGFSNPSVVRNIGIRQARGDIVIIQNPEVRFTKPTDLENILAPTEENPLVSCSAPCESLNEDGRHNIWYADPNLMNYNHFCEAYRRDCLIAIGGFDEGFRGYGYEDNDFNWRLGATGVTCQWAKNVVTQHQWHPGHPNSNDRENEEFNQAYGTKAIEDYRAGLRTLEANVGKHWGDLNS